MPLLAWPSVIALGLGGLTPVFNFSRGMLAILLVGPEMVHVRGMSDCGEGGGPLCLWDGKLCAIAEWGE